MGISSVSETFLRVQTVGAAEDEHGVLDTQTAKQHGDTVHTQTETHRVSINTRLLRKLPKLPAKLTLYTVHGYVVAYEECHASH